VKINSEEEFQEAVRLYHAEIETINKINEIAWNIQFPCWRRRNEIAWAIKDWEERQGKNV